MFTTAQIPYLLLQDYILPWVFVLKQNNLQSDFFNTIPDIHWFSSFTCSMCTPLKCTIQFLSVFFGSLGCHVEHGHQVLVLLQVLMPYWVGVITFVLYWEILNLSLVSSDLYQTNRMVQCTPRRCKQIWRPIWWCRYDELTSNFLSKHVSKLPSEFSVFWKMCSWFSCCS